MTLCTVGFDDLVTSFVATIATGWSDPCRVGLSPTGKPRLSTAHSEKQCYIPRPEAGAAPANDESKIDVTAATAPAGGRARSAWYMLWPRTYRVKCGTV